MKEAKPCIIENREFVELEEEDIQRLNRLEAEKFRDNPHIAEVMAEVEHDLGSDGHWEEHWMTVDPTGQRVYARVYYTDEHAKAITSNGEAVRMISYPVSEDNRGRS